MDIQTKTDIIHQKIYDFLLYIYPLLTKYPKYEKFSLQTATRNAILGEQTAGYDGAELKERAENLQLRERQDL